MSCIGQSSSSITSSSFQPIRHRKSTNTRFSGAPLLPSNVVVSAEIAMNMYRGNLYFHGTSLNSAELILKKGMDITEKVHNGNNTFLKKQYGLDDQNASSYNYIQKTPKEAAEYAKALNLPHILSMILPPSQFQLSKDPEGDSETAFMTAQAIAKKYIFPLSPDKLHRKQLTLINEKLGISLDKGELKKLKKLVQEEILIDRSELIQNSKSYLEQEAIRDKKTKTVLQQAGIDLSNCQEGETFSIVFD